MHDGQHRDEGEIPKACNSHYVAIASHSTDFSYPGPTIFGYTGRKELTIKYFTLVELTISDNNSCTLTNHDFGKRT